MDCTSGVDLGASRRGKNSGASGANSDQKSGAAIGKKAAAPRAATVTIQIIRQRLQQFCRVPLPVFCNAHARPVGTGRIVRHAGEARLR